MNNFDYLEKDLMIRLQKQKDLLKDYELYSPNYNFTKGAIEGYKSSLRLLKINK